MVDRKICGRWQRALVVMAGLCASAASAQQPEAVAGPIYAVMSVIGDQLTVVTRQSATGTSMDRNLRQDIPLRDDHFDRLALMTAQSVVAKAAPGSATRLLLTSHKDVFSRGTADFPVGADARAFIDPIATQVRADNARYLLLVTKFRGEARLRLTDGTVGSGKLTGLGFYVDQSIEVQRESDGDGGTGLVAPYAYLRISLIDLSTGQVVGSESTTLSTVAHVRSTTSSNPWEVLTAQEKVSYLDRLVADAVTALVPHLLAGR